MILKFCNPESLNYRCFSAFLYFFVSVHCISVKLVSHLKNRKVQYSCAVRHNHSCNYASCFEHYGALGQLWTPWGNYGHKIHNLWGKCGHLERIIIIIAYFVDMIFIAILLISDTKFCLWDNLKFRDFWG